MTGGFGGRGLPLRARSGVRAQVPEALAPACPVRHCWVSAPVDGGARRPGLLLEWRRDPAQRWEGRVTYPAELRPGRWSSVEEWLPAELLQAPDGGEPA